MPRTYPLTIVPKCRCKARKKLPVLFRSILIDPTLHLRLHFDMVSVVIVWHESIRLEFFHNPSPKPLDGIEKTWSTASFLERFSNACYLQKEHRIRNTCIYLNDCFKSTQSASEKKSTGNANMPNTSVMNLRAPIGIGEQFHGHFFHSTFGLIRSLIGRLYSLARSNFCLHIFSSTI